MTKFQTDLLIKTGIFLATVGFLILASFHVDPQASMDAAYYHVMVDQLDNGQGFTEPVIWHHLNKYETIEHPMDYWMPLGIVLYYLSRMLMGIAGEVLLNILIWAVLAVLIYGKALELTESKFCTLIALLAHMFCGRNIFCLLTTDNTAFAGILGYLFFNSLGSKNSVWPKTAIIGGLIALLRIEGLIFAAFGGLFEFYKTRQLKVLFLYTCLLLAVISPWIIRNIQVLGTPWPGNSKVVFLQNYGEFFNEKFKGTLNHYLEQGCDEILSQKLNGLKISILNLVLVPAHFLFLPVWLSGLVAFWQRGNPGYTLFFVIVFCLLCGLAFTHQSEHGTALHISAYFYPSYAILSGLGLSALLKRAKTTRRFTYYCLGIAMVAWSVFVSYVVNLHSAVQYATENAPYIQLFEEFTPEPEDQIVSPYPLYVYFLTGCKGVVASKFTTAGPEAVADKYGCNIIITHSQHMHPVSPHPQGWNMIASNPISALYKRPLFQQ